MIARLRGTLVERQEDGAVVDCGGVGYDVNVSAMTLGVLPEVGDEVTLRVFTHAQENRVALYGFATAEERQIFDLLITVKNVGPSTAIGILSGSSAPQALARLIAAGDIPGLTRIRGVGKKTADLIVVELREKCEWLLANWGAAGGTDASSAPRGPRPAILEDVASALANMGWRPAEVDKAVTSLAPNPGATVQTLLREALRALPR